MLRSQALWAPPTPPVVAARPLAPALRALGQGRRPHASHRGRLQVTPAAAAAAAADDSPGGSGSSGGGDLRGDPVLEPARKAMEGQIMERMEDLQRKLLLAQRALQVGMGCPQREEVPWAVPAGPMASSGGLQVASGGWADRHSGCGCGL